MKNILDELKIRYLDDLVDKEYLQKIRDTLARSTGIEVIISRPEADMGGYLTSFKMMNFCQEMRQNPEYNGKCMQAYQEGTKNILQQEGVVIIKCHLGMFAFAAPIKVEGRVLGFIGGCQVSPKEKLISRGACRALYKKYQYQGDFRRLFKSLEEFPVLTEKNLGGTLDLFLEMANSLTEIAKKQLQIKKEELKREKLARYFSPAIYNLIGGKEQDLTFKGNATVLFSDIRNFTAKSEKMTPVEVVNMLNEYFEEMVDVIFKHNGTLDKFIGDAILAVFGAPVSGEDNAMNAVRAAVEMVERLEALNQRRREQGKDSLDIGIGIHTGEVLAGNIGSSKRIEYTVIGDTVNIASRLESITKNYAEKIVISEATRNLVQDVIISAGQDNVQLKGKSEMMDIHRVVGVR